MQVSIEQGRQRRVSSERCNCLCPGCLRSNLERETGARCFNSLIAALLRAGRADNVTAPGQLPEFRVHRFQENHYLSPYALKCCCGAEAASRSDYGSTNRVLRFLVLNQKCCGHRPQVANGVHPRPSSDFFKTRWQVDSAPAPFTPNRVLPTCPQRANPLPGAWDNLTETWPHAWA